MFKVKLLSKKVVAKNKWTTISNEVFQSTNNYQNEYLVVERPPAIMILPIKKDNGKYFTFLVNQYRYPINKKVWQFPMGTLDKNKDPKKQAIDELREETGVVARKITFLKKIYVDPGLSRQECIIYIAEDLEDTGIQELDETEKGMTTKMAAVSELDIMIKDGSIIDSWGYIGVYTLLKYFHYTRVSKKD